MLRLPALGVRRGKALFSECSSDRITAPAESNQSSRGVLSVAAMHKRCRLWGLPHQYNWPARRAQLRATARHARCAAASESGSFVKLMALASLWAAVII